MYLCQLLLRFVANRLFGNPLQNFTDFCSLANISVFSLTESTQGHYIHGHSPHGFSDTDISSIVLQLQRESQKMCGKRGLLSDSDQQIYTVIPPGNLRWIYLVTLQTHIKVFLYFYRKYYMKLLLPFQKPGNVSNYHRDIGDGHMERNSLAYNGTNRFFCAFIDHVSW